MITCVEATPDVRHVPHARKDKQPPVGFDLYGDASGGGTARAGSGAPAALGLRADRRKRLTVLQDGMVLLRGALDLETQQAVVDMLRDLGRGSAGFYTPRTKGGTMHLQMMCLGHRTRAPPFARCRAALVASSGR